MARSRYKFIEGSAPHFLTVTVVNWIPLFSSPTLVQILLDSLCFLQNERRLILYAYVILENHLHLIASAPDLSKQIGNFKSYTAPDDRLSCGTPCHECFEQLAWHKLRHKY